MKLDHEDDIHVAILNALDNEALSHEHLQGDALEIANAQGVFDNYVVYAEQYGINPAEFKELFLKTYSWFVL